MGDHRASIKIRMEFHDEVSETDMWINYFPDDHTGVDRRVIEFFEAAYRKGMNRYNEEMFEYMREERKRAEKEKELAELARLKEKYEK